MKSKDLIIGKKEAEPLNKHQLAFNRLVKKLEKLRRELTETTKILGEKLDFYGKHLHPLEQKLNVLRIALVKRLFEIYKTDKRLSKNNKNKLLELISMQLDAVLAASGKEPDDELKEIFREIEGISFEQAAEEDFAALKEDMEQTFEEFGVKIDLGDFNREMSEEEMIRKMQEISETVRSEQEAKEAARPPRKKTKKQLEKEEREKQIEEAKSRSISGTYKQLARIFHPDLEQNLELKKQKEDLMKQLTMAYEANDLHTLLKLELEWIEKQAGNLDRLSDDKLSIYNEMLKEQARELEAEVFFLAQHPRYQPLTRFALVMPFGVKHIDLKREQRKMERQIAEAETTLKELNNQNAQSEVKNLLAAFKRSKQKVNLFEIDFERFFDD